MLSILKKLLVIPPDRRQNHHLEKIANALKDIPVLTPHIDKPQFQVICRSIFIEEYQTETTIFKEGDEADKFYIVLEGEVKIFQRTKEDSLPAAQLNIEYVREVALLTEGQSFGEYLKFLQLSFKELPCNMILQEQQLQNQAIILNQLQLRSRSLNQLFNVLQDIIQLKDVSVNEKIDRIYKFLLKVPLMKFLKEHECVLLAAKSICKTCPSGSVIIQPSETPKGIFFLLRGIVKVIYYIVRRGQLFTESNDNDEDSDPYDYIPFLKFQQERQKKLVAIKNYKPFKQAEQFKLPDSDEFKNIFEVEIDQVGAGNYFFEYEALTERKSHFSLIAQTECEIYVLPSFDLKNSLSQEQLNQMLLASKTYPAIKQISECNEKLLEFERSKKQYLQYFKQENSLVKWKSSHSFYRSPLPKLVKLPHIRSSNSEEKSHKYELNKYLNQKLQSQHQKQKIYIDNQNPSSTSYFTPDSNNFTPLKPALKKLKHQQQKQSKQIAIQEIKKVHITERYNQYFA